MMLNYAWSCKLSWLGLHLDLALPSCSVGVLLHGTKRIVSRKEIMETNSQSSQEDNKQTEIGENSRRQAYQWLILHPFLPSNHSLHPGSSPDLDFFLASQLKVQLGLLQMYFR